MVEQPISGVSLWPPHNQPSLCTGCPLAGRGGGFVPGCGDLKATLVVVGERPGEHERRAGLPFVHKSGKVLDQSIGGRDDVFITNIRKCFVERETPEEKLRAVRHCARAYLTQEMAALHDAKSMLLVGGDATHTVLGLRGVQYLHGSVWTRPEAEQLWSDLVEPPQPFLAA